MDLNKPWGWGTGQASAPNRNVVAPLSASPEQMPGGPVEPSMGQKLQTEVGGALANEAVDSFLKPEAVADLGDEAVASVGTEASMGAASNAVAPLAGIGSLLEGDYDKAAGKAAGAVFGSAFGPIGTMVGSKLGGVAGDKLGDILGFQWGTTSVGGKGAAPALSAATSPVRSSYTPPATSVGGKGSAPALSSAASAVRSSYTPPAATPQNAGAYFNEVFGSGKGSMPSQSPVGYTNPAPVASTGYRPISSPIRQSFSPAPGPTMPWSNYDDGGINSGG